MSEEIVRRSAVAVSGAGARDKKQKKETTRVRLCWSRGQKWGSVFIFFQQ